MCAFSKDVLNEVSPYTAHSIKPVVKLPMILVMGVCGIMSGITATFFKFLGELIESQGFTDYPMLTISLFVTALFGAWVLFYTINWAMRYYE